MAESSQCPETDVLCAVAKAFPFPREYLVVDLETSGYSHNNDLIVATSWGDVQDGRAGGYGGAILDWTRVPALIDVERFCWQIRRLESEFAKAGRAWHYPLARIRAEGVDPLPALHTFLTTLHGAMTARKKLVGHNLVGFDARFINMACDRFFNGYELPWCGDAVYDTAVIEKSLVTLRPPWIGESLEDWSTRVHKSKAGKGQKYNLSGHCVTKYDLIRRFNLDLASAHRSEFDILLTHHLFETYRANSEAHCR